MQKKNTLFLLLLCFSISFAQNNRFFDKGIYFYDKNEIDSSLFYFKKHVKLHEKSHDTVKAYGYLYIGKIYKIKQEHQKSLEYFNLSETIFSNNDNFNRLTETYISIAEFYRAKYDLESSERFLNLANKLIETRKISQKIIAYYWNRKAAICIEKDDDYLASIKCSKKVIQIAKKINDSSLIASSYNEIGYAYENLNDTKAAEYYKKAINFYKKNKDELSEINVLSNIVRFNDKQGKIYSSKELIDRGYKLSYKLGEIIHIKNFNNYNYLYYKSIENFEKALYYLELFKKAEKEEFLSKWNSKIIDAERKYDLAKKEKQIQERDNEIKIQNLEIENTTKKFWLIFIIFLLTIIGIITLTYFFKREKKSNKQLRVLSDENEFLLSEAHHRINNNLQLITILINNQLDKSTHSESIEFKKIISKIGSIATLHRHLYKSNDKKNIEIKDYLTDIYSNFSELFKQNDIISNFEVSSFKINIDQAMYIGLILTELYINSIKHAFYNQAYKQIDFNLTIEKNQIILNYQDNGELIKGKPMPKPSLIHQLCRQLEVECSIKTTNGFQISFIKLI